MHISGPAGAIEAELELAPQEKTITAVLCHPHPQYGGTMHDAVLATLARVLLQRGVNCLRFNFRGVGASEGRYDDGHGEQDDLTAVCAWVADEYPRDTLWLGGYSFGASIVWQCLEQLNPERGLLVAPPVGAMAFAATTYTGKLSVFAGDRDTFVDLPRFEALFGANGHIINGADHFFAARHGELATSIEAALDV